MDYRITERQVSGTHGCVRAVVLQDARFNRRGMLALSIRDEVTILSTEQARYLAEFLLEMDADVTHA